jgi:hypothetical protein
MSNGQRVTMDTLFKDFREVAGVRQPHRIETLANGKLIHVTLIDRMEANVEIPAGTFAKPLRMIHAEATKP